LGEDFCVRCAEDLEAEAAALRGELIIQECRKMDDMWVHDALQGNGLYFAGGSGETFAPIFPEMEVRRADIPSDGLCQYASISKAAFGGHVAATRLQHLAVKFLRVYKASYEESTVPYITGGDDGHNGGGERFDALTRLKQAGLITRLGYDGYMDALNLPVDEGVEFGQDQTLAALAEMLHLGMRLVVRAPARATKHPNTSEAPDTMDPIPCHLLRTDQPRSDQGPAAV
jgi:hypothetical protein